MTEIPQGENATFSYLDLITLALVLDAVPDFTHGNVINGSVCLWLSLVCHAIGVRWAISRYLIPPGAITLFVYAFRYCIEIEGGGMRYVYAAALGAAILIVAVLSYEWIGKKNPPLASSSSTPLIPPHDNPPGNQTKVSASSQSPARSKSDQKIKRPKSTGPSQTTPNDKVPEEEQIGPSGPRPNIPFIPETFPRDENGNPVGGGGGITVGGGTHDLNIHNNRMARDIRVVPATNDNGADVKRGQISHNSFGGNSAIDNAGKIEDAEVSGNRIRGDNATAVRNEPTGEIKRPVVKDNDIGESPIQRVDWHDKQNWRQLLRQGMSKAEIRQLFGEPDQTSRLGGIESWEYGSGRVSFEVESHIGGSLYSWSEPLEKAKP